MVFLLFFLFYHLGTIQWFHLHCTLFSNLSVFTVFPETVFLESVITLSYNTIKKVSVMRPVVLGSSGLRGPDWVRPLIIL